MRLATRAELGELCRLPATIAQLPIARPKTLTCAMFKVAQSLNKIRKVRNLSRKKSRSLVKLHHKIAIHF